MDDENDADRKEDEANLVQEEVRTIKKDERQSVSVCDSALVAAFINGDEGIAIIQVKCVWYDQCLR